MFRCAPPSPASCKLLKISATRWWNVSHTTGSSDSPRIKDMIGWIWDRKGRIVSTFAAFPNLVPPHSQWHPQLRLPASFHMFEQAQAEVCLCALLICSVRKAGMPTFPVWKQRNIFLPAIVLTWSRKSFGWSRWQEFIFPSRSTAYLYLSSISASLYHPQISTVSVGTSGKRICVMRVTKAAFSSGAGVFACSRAPSCTWNPSIPSCPGSWYGALAGGTGGFKS